MKTILVWTDKKIIIRHVDCSGATVEILAKMMLQKISANKDDPQWQVIDGVPDIEIRGFDYD